MPEIGTSGLMSEDGKRGNGQRPQATAPVLDSTKCDIADRAKGSGSPAVYTLKIRSALPCAMRFRSVAVTGIWSKNKRASAIDP